MLRKLKWLEVEPDLVAIWHNAKSKEISDCYLKNLHLELQENCPVRNIIGVQNFPVYREFWAKNKKDRKIVKESNTIAVNHYRRMRRSYYTYGIAGVIGYLRNILAQFRLPEEGTKEREKITPEELKNYEIIDYYFRWLMECVLKGVLPKRNYHDKLLDISGSTENN